MAGVMSARSHTPVRRRRRQEQSQPQFRTRIQSKTLSSHSNPNINLSVRLHLPETLKVGWVLHVTTRVLWRHLLYARGLVPIPVHQIVSENDPLTNQTLSSSLLRKVAQAKTRLDQLDDEWETVRNLCCEIKYVMISIGPSWYRSKECYWIDPTMLHSSLEKDGIDLHKTEDELETEKSKRNETILSRRLLQNLVQAEMSHSKCHRLASSFQIFITFLVSYDTATRIFENSNANHFGHFIVRHGFQPPPKHASRLVTLSLARQLSGEIAEETKKDSFEPSGGVWISLRSSIKGFRL